MKNAQKEYIKIGETVTYNEQESPLKFGTYITYSFSENMEDTKKINVNYFLKSATGFNRTRGGELSINAYQLSSDIPSYSLFVGFVGIH